MNRIYGKRKENGLKSVCRDCKKLMKCDIRDNIVDEIDVTKFKDISIVLHIENCPVMKPNEPGRVLKYKYPSVNLL